MIFQKLKFQKDYSIAQNFNEVGTTRKLVKKTLVVGRGKAHSIFELTRPHNYSVNKTFCGLVMKSTKVFSCQSLCYMIFVPLKYPACMTDHN